MNNKELAIDVFKHPLIQEILKRKLAESSVVNRLIVEEILSEELTDNEMGDIRYLIDMAEDENQWPNIL